MSQKPKDGTVADLTIANSVVNLIQGDIQEHLRMTHILWQEMCWAWEPPPASTTANSLFFEIEITPALFVAA